MDFTPELSAFQGVILSADNVHQFSRLTSKGGNEENIQYVLDSLIRFLKGENYCNDNGLIETSVVKMRKFALFIVLNADLPVLEKMVELEGIDLVIWTIPTIPRHLMCEMLWNLHMEPFVYEIITYAYPQLSLEVLGAFIDHFKYFNPTECLLKLHRLSYACYSLICRLHCFAIDNDELSNMLTTAFNNLQKLLKYFNVPPNDYKLNSLSKDDLYKYLGRCLHSALTLVYKCMNQFIQKVNQHSCDNIYNLTYKEGCFKNNLPNFLICDTPNSLILECLNNSNTLLLDTSKELVMGVSVDVFCAWSEFQENGRTMQYTIGELCHKVRTKLLSVPSVSEHPIVSMIQQIARKPTEIKDVITTLDSKTIIDNINKNKEDKKLWIRALLYKDTLCEHMDLLQVIDDNITALSEGECYQLYEILKTYMNNHTANAELIRALSVTVFQHCSVSDKHNIIKQLFSNNCFSDMTESADLVDAITEVFNKLIATPNGKPSDVLTLFLQNPYQVYTKIFTTASENIYQTGIMLEIMKLLFDYTNYYYNSDTEPCIFIIAKNIFEKFIDTESRQDNFIKFICGLKNMNIIPGTKLLLLIVMPLIHKALLNRNIVALNMQVRLIRDAFQVTELMNCRAPMLAMLAQILEVVRWRKITVFNPSAPATLYLTLHLQSVLMNTYDGVVPDKEKKWLKTKLRSIEPMNMYYYRILWNPPGKTFFEVITNKTVNSNTNTGELTVWMTQIICSSIQQEWSELWDSLPMFDDATLFKLFCDAVAIITRGEGRHRNELSRSCLMYIYRNIVYITRYKFFKEPLTETQVAAAGSHLASLLRHSNTTDVDEIGSILMPLFVFLVEKRNTISLNLPKYFNNIFRDTRYLEIINKVFSVPI